MTRLVRGCGASSPGGQGLGWCPWHRLLPCHWVAGSPTLTPSPGLARLRPKVSPKEWPPLGFSPKVCWLVLTITSLSSLGTFRDIHVSGPQDPDLSQAPARTTPLPASLHVLGFLFQLCLLPALGLCPLRLAFAGLGLCSKWAKVGQERCVHSRNQEAAGGRCASHPSRPIHLNQITRDPGGVVVVRTAGNAQRDILGSDSLWTVLQEGDSKRTWSQVQSAQDTRGRST